MKHLLISVLLFTLLSCKKEEKTQEYWQQKTTETHNKLISLSDKYTCSDMPNISIKSIKEYMCTSYVLVHKSDDAKFDKLINEYEYYHKKLKESGYYSTISMLCTEELNSEELQVEMAKLYNEIKNYYNNTSCDNPNDWLGLTLHTEKDIEAIALKKGDTNFNYKVNTYNQAIVRKLRSEGKEKDFDTTDKIVVKCESNKAIAEFE